MKVDLMIEGQEDVTWDDWRALAAACEQHGIDTLFRSDHYLSVVDADGRGSLDAWATISALAAVTTRLRLGTLVSPATFRHPAVLSRLVVTADHISNGRVELGIGAGWFEAEHEAFGIPLPEIRPRMDGLEQQLAAITTSWEDGPGLPKPIQSPRPLLILGGTGKPRSLRLAARFADEYNVPEATSDQLVQIRRGLDHACEAVGRAPATLPLSLMTGWLVGADREDLRERASRFAIWDRLGDADAVLSGIPDSWISGTVPEALDQLADLESVGVARVMAQHPLHRDLDAIALLGRDVIANI